MSGESRAQARLRWGGTDLLALGLGYDSNTDRNLPILFMLNS